MAYITNEQFIQYDSLLKNYVQSEISKATSQDKLTINKLNNTIEELNNRITELEMGANTEYTHMMARSVSTPMLLSDIDYGMDSYSVYTLEDDYYTLNDGISLMSIHPETIIVQEDIQEDYVIYDRVISPNEDKQYKNIVVTTDNKSNRIFFSMWYTFDDRELENKEINIIWLNAEGNKGESTCVDKQLIGDRLYFAWNIPGIATVKAGTIRYAVRIVDTDYEWNSLPAELECVQGLMDDGWDDIEDAKETPGWVDYIEGKYKSNLMIITEAEYTAIEEPSDNTMYAVKMNSGDINLYVGTTQIHTGGGGGEGGIANIVQLTSSQYNALGDRVDPETLYLLTD